MEVNIFVETTFDDGETKKRNIGRLRRAPDEFGSESLGLLLNDAKTLLRRLQETIVQDQVGEAMEARRKCDGCGKQRAIHDDRGRILDTLFGRIRVKWPRLRRCLCQPAGVAKSGPQSPLAGLFSDRATAELRRLQAELGARHSFREAARLIEMFMPCSA
ncbi:MAG: ISKra4 family transposase, partial [Sulfitobacter sp.]